MPQQYLLDFDDVLDASFFNKKNADQLIRGMNTSGTAGSLAVAVGGSGNKHFVAGETLVFDGSKFVSSGFSPSPVDLTAWTNDDRYYTKTQIDEKFNSLASTGGFPVAWANITGAPASGIRIQFLDPQVRFFSGTTAEGSRVVRSIGSVPAGRTVIAALVNVQCAQSGPDSEPYASMLFSQTATSVQVAVGAFRASAGDDGTAGRDNAIVPVDSATNTFYSQLVGINLSDVLVAAGTTVANTPVRATLVGYLFTS